MSPQSIDPRLQYSYVPAAAEALRRAQQHQQQQQQQQQSQQHAPPEVHSAPHQPYYLPPTSHAGNVGVTAEQSYDPNLVEEDSGDDSAEHGSPPGDGSSQAAGGPPGAQDPKRSRACDSCRGLKVKCDFGENAAPGESCKRCAKARRPCIVTPATRRRQKKADSRVAELERKVDALTARLAEQAGGSEESHNTHNTGKRSTPPYRGGPSPYHHHQHDPNQVYSPDKRRRIDPPSPAQQRNSHRVPTHESHGTSGTGPTGIFDQGIPKIFDHSDVDRKISQLISTSMVDRIFNRYVHQMALMFPAVTFPSGTRAEHIRKSRPILFLAILSSTCFGLGIPAETQEALEELLRDVIADSMWKKGEKSLEIIQSLQVATLWYRPPHNFEQHMFYQMVHASAVMAVDIGIGKKMAPSRRKQYDHARRPGLPNPESAEIRRAWLTSYFLCTSMSIVLRRAVMFRWAPYMQDCLDYLESSAEDTQPSDAILCQQIRLSHISEDIAVRFALDDPSVIMSMSEGKVRTGIKTFERELTEIMSRNVTDQAIRLSEHNTSLLLHEISLHSQHNVEDFKSAFIDETFKPGVTPKLLGPHHVEALKACRTACCNILETYLSGDMDVVYLLPVIFSVRCLYALVVLIKIYMAAKAPGEISTIISRNELPVKDFIERLQTTFSKFMERDPKSPHSKFLFVLDRVIMRFNDIERTDIDPAKASNAIQAAQAAQAIAVQMAAQATKANPPLAREANLPQQGNKTAPHPQGLHLLSEVAMSNTNGPTANGSAQMSQGQAAGPQPQHGWYPGSAMGQTGMPIDPSGYTNYPNLPVGGFENFDYGLGTVGMGMDGAISGLFMADGLWNYNEPYTQMPPPSGAGWQ